MKNFLGPVFLILPALLLFYCSLADETVKFEGNWWQDYTLSTNGSVSADNIGISSNQMVFNADRTYSSMNPFTGDAAQGRWIIDKSRRVIIFYNNIVTFTSNGVIYTNTAASGLILTNKYDFPESDKMRIYDPTNSIFFIELTRY